MTIFPQKTRSEIFVTQMTQNRHMVFTQLSHRNPSPEDAIRAILGGYKPKNELA